MLKKTLFFVALLSLGWSQHAFAQGNELMPGFFHEFSADQNRAAVADAPNELIDPFSGVLNLSHNDIVIPGNGGMDIVLNRVYSSNNVYQWGLRELMDEGSLGRGWEMHMGRVLVGAGGACVNTSNNTTLLLETPTGSQQKMYKNQFGITDADYLSKDHWVLHCNTANGQVTGSMRVIDPNGVEYSMDRRANTTSRITGISSVAWYPTEITDRNGNRLTIDYRNASANDGVTLDRIRASDGRTVDFSHASNGRITSIAAEGRTWRFSYDSAGNLTRVRRPVGEWNYTYHSSPYRLLRQVTHPAGANVEYTYERRCMSVVSCSLVSFDGDTIDAFSLVVSRKSQSGASVNAGNWTYAYARSGDFDTTTVRSEEGRVEYRHYSRANAGMWRIGLLESKRVYEGNSLVQQESYEYERGLRLNAQENVRRPYVVGTFAEFGIYATRMTEKTINRDGTNYVTRYSNFSDGINPRRIQEIGQDTKTTTVTYFPRRNGQNIVSLAQNESFGSSVNQRVTRTYDSRGNLTRAIEYGVSTTYGYDSQGNVTSVRDARGSTTRFSSYHRGVARSEAQPNSVNISRSVNDYGQILSERNGEGNSTTYSYDSLGRVTAIRYPLGNALSMAWSSNQRSQTITRGGFSSRVTYDGFSQEICREAEGIFTTKRYSTGGVLMFQSLPVDSCSTNFGQSFSGMLGRMTQMRFEDNTRKSYSYQSNNRVTVNDERNQSYRFSYRAYGSPDDKVLLSVTGPESLSISIARNVLGQATRVTRNGTARSFNYGSSTFVQSENHPETGTTRYGRDALGNLTSKQVGAASQINYRYDARNRMTRIDYASGTPDVAYAYDRNDNVTRVNSGIANIRYSYDNNDNLTREQQTISGVNYFIDYRYNGLDYLTNMTYPDGRSVSFNPNDLGWPTAASPYVTSVSYTRFGQPTAIRYRNGRSMTQSYVARKWPRQTVVSGGVYNRSRSYDPAGNLLTLSDNLNSANNRTLRYDGLERLTSASGPWGAGTIRYSNTDDITQKTIGSSNLAYNYNNERISSMTGVAGINGSAQLAYDGNGNITQQANATQGWRYEYDAASHLRRVFTRGGALLRSNDYSGNGMLVRTVKTGEERVFVYTKGGLLVNEFVTQGEKPNLANIYLGTRLVAEASSQSGPVTPPTIFGFGYGSSNHRVSYSKAFNVPSVPFKASFCVDGYGINSTREVRVTLNGSQLGYLLPGGNDRARESCFDLPRNLIRAGNNTITFTQANPGQTWGVGVFTVSVVQKDAGFMGGIIMLLLDDDEPVNDPVPNDQLLDAVDGLRPQDSTSDTNLSTEAQ